jgi:hypothetical protein
MSTISPIRATLAALTAVLALTAAPADAAQFTVSRGLNLDQWVTWPGPDRWGSKKVLGNFPEWKAFVSDDDLAGLRAAGLDFLRMPVDPAVFLVNADAARQKRLFDGVTGAVDRIRAAGLKVIVDLHTIPRGKGQKAPGTNRILSDNTLFSAYRRLVNDMADHLARYDADAVALELINEPLLDCGRSDTQWPRQLADLHAAARAANPKITLVVQGACWGSADGLAALDPKALADANVIWSFHSYDPFILTHQSASWAGEDVKHLSGLPYPFSGLRRRERKAAVDANLERIGRDAPSGQSRKATDFLIHNTERLASPRRLKRTMREPFRAVSRWADRNGIPHDRILLGEFGMIRQEYGKAPATKPEWRAAYYRDMIALAEENGFAWAMWSYGGAFGVVDAYDGKKAAPDVMQVVRGLPGR